MSCLFDRVDLEDPGQLQTGVEYHAGRAELLSKVTVLDRSRGLGARRVHQAYNIPLDNCCPGDQISCVRD